MTEPGVRLGWWLSSEEHDPRDLVRHARAAEDAGFTTALISDHLRPWVPSQANAAHVWTVLGAIAHVTDAMEVGTGVTAMMHRTSPIVLAHAAATAAVMFEGRFFLGVGTGERLNEQAFGERWPRAGERRDRLAEGVALIRRLCSGENVNHRGAWAVENLRLATLPAAPPRIFVAASGKRSAALAGEIGDGMIGVAPDGSIVDVFRSTSSADTPVVGQLHVSLAADLETARESAWTWWPNAVVPPSLLGELARPEEFEAVADAIGPAGIDKAVLCATGAAPVIAAIDRFVGAGFDTVHLHQVGPDQARLAAMATGELFPHYAHRA